MNQCVSMPLSGISADICIVPAWLLHRLEKVGEPCDVLAEGKKSANILSDEEIIYYLNGFDCILQQRNIMSLLMEGLNVWYVQSRGQVISNNVFEILTSAARIQRHELSVKYAEEFSERAGHIVMGHYLRGPDSSVDLSAAWHVCFDVYQTGKATYVTYDVKAGHRLPHADRDFCRKLLKKLEPYAEREQLRQSNLYRTAISNN